nr:MAG TPA: hypothetical protein [Bacteriophage sp.]
MHFKILNIYSTTTYLSHLQNLKILVIHLIVYLYLSYLINILIIYSCYKR